MAADREEARHLLIDSARPFASAGVEGCGRGVLDARAALRALDARIDARIRDEENLFEGPLQEAPLLAAA